MSENRYEEMVEEAVRPTLEFKQTPYLPFYRENILYTTCLKDFLYPYEFTGWKDEQLSWKKTCYLHGGLNPSPLFRFSGPGAKTFLSKYCVNTFEKFPAGTGKHCITCDEEGLITSDGLILRVGVDEYETYWMWSLAIAAQIDAGKYEMEFKDLSADNFLFQVGGPSSLAVLEAACADDLHDIRFMNVGYSTVNGKKVRIVRLGMAGTLAYEVHGDIADAPGVYDAIYRAGKPKGLRRLGWHAYMMQHTENGFPQFGYHFMMKLPGMPSLGAVTGSIGPEADGYANPVDLGWKSTVKFDHDFMGRPALEKIAANQTRDMVTLEWNKEDVLDVYASRFEDAEPYADFDSVNDIAYSGGLTVLHQDKVLDGNGRQIGISSGRMYSSYYRRMISLCSLDVAHTKEGTEVVILWGGPGTRQKKIRANVARFPYYNENRNQTFDVEAIPRGGS